MTDTNQKKLGSTLWGSADQLRGAMDADDFRDYMLSFLFLRYLSDSLEGTHRILVDIERDIQKALHKHNEFLKELGLPRLPSADAK